MRSQKSIDPEVYAVASMFPEVNFADANGTRALFSAMLQAAAPAGGPAFDPGIAQLERVIPSLNGGPDVPIRIYTPATRTSMSPAYVSFHGGAFILGDLDTEHARCLKMSLDGNAVVVAVDYRLAPENAFPAGVEDCYSALHWVASNAPMLGIDPTKIVVGGSSAGGALAAAVALMARDRSGPSIAMQMLFYPVIDDRGLTESMKTGHDALAWNSRNVRDMWAHYLGAERSETSPYAAPGRATDLANLPSAYVVTCEHDPLRDEGLEYAARMLQSGVSVELHNYAGTVHGFDLLIPNASVSIRALDDAVAAFQRATK